MKRRQFLISTPLTAVPAFLRDRGDAVANLASARAGAARTGDSRARPVAKAADAPLIQTSPDRWGLAVKAGRPPTLDGRLEDRVWRRARPLRGLVTPYFNEPADSEISARLAYDDRALYIGLSCEGREPVRSLVALEVLLATSADADRYFRIPVGVKDVTPQYANEWGAGLETPADIRTEVKTGDDHVSAEVRVPLASLGVTELTGGDEWRGNVIAQHEMMTSPLATWTPIRRSSNHYAGRGATVESDVTGEGRLGSIFLGHPPAAEGGDRPEPWQPGGLKLRYQGFTEKVLSLPSSALRPREGLVLRWKARGGPWTTLENLARERVADRIHVTFDHPPPTANGLYQLQVLISPAGPGSRRKPRLAILTFDRHGLIQAGDALYATAEFS